MNVVIISSLYLLYLSYIYFFLVPVAFLPFSLTFLLVSYPRSLPSQVLLFLPFLLYPSLPFSNLLSCVPRLHFTSHAISTPSVMLTFIPFLSIFSCLPFPLSYHPLQILPRLVTFLALVIIFLLTPAIFFPRNILGVLLCRWWRRWWLIKGVAFRGEGKWRLWFSKA